MKQAPSPFSLKTRKKMIRIADIQNALLPLIGWHQDYDPQHQIDESLTQSESGLYYQDAHPLMTLQNVRSIMPDGFKFQYPAWDKDKQYKKGDKCQYGDVVYKALHNNVNEQPNQSEDWEVFDIVSDFIREQTLSGIALTVQTFLQIKGLLRES